MILVISTFSVLCIAFSPDNYLYQFNEIYDGKDPAICYNDICSISYYIGENVQTFPLSSARYFNPKYMPCGLEFKIIKIAQLDINDNEIPYYTADMLNPERLFYLQAKNYNYTYCNPQLEISSTSSTAFPFGKAVTDTFQAEFYPQLNCTTVNAFLSSSQVYMTNGTLLDNSFGAVSIDVSTFTNYGYIINQAKNESQFVEPGNVMVNFTLSRIEWSGNVACTSNKQIAHSLLIVFYVAGDKIADEITGPDSAYGCNIGYDLNSGITILSGIGVKDGVIIGALPKYIGSDFEGHRNFFSIKISRFDNYFSYGGVYLMQNKDATCEEGEIITGDKNKITSCCNFLKPLIHTTLASNCVISSEIIIAEDIPF
ncbi:hypothetical protein HZS_2690 [Henneguya salminicola]|nr:hypothetical protein HZS_2690 [Henneguya salminicola]